MTVWTVKEFPPGTHRPGYGDRVIPVEHVGDTDTVCLIRDDGSGYHVWWKRDDS